MKALKKKQSIKQAYFDLINKALFFVLMLILPFQLGRHFFFPFSYIYGIRVDYLSPTLYLQDIIIFMLFVFNIKTALSFLRNKIVLLIMSIFILNAIFSLSKPLDAYGLLRLIEIFVLISLGKTVIKSLKTNGITLALLFGAIVEISLSLSQFILKRSLQGPFYFIGERLFNLSTPGIAKISFNGIEFLRPYGSFSHPNSMAGFYLLTYFFILTTKKFDRNYILKYFSLLVFSCLVFISFSKVAIFSYFVLNVLFLVMNGWKCKVCNVAKLTVVSILSALFIILTKGDPLTVDKRIELIKNSFLILVKHPFGVGLNNYLVAQAGFSSRFYLFINQPVHNIFLLLLTELGPLFTGLLIYLCFRFLRVRSFSKEALIVVLAVVFTGFFDHYWLTLIQNWLLMGVVLSIVLQDHVLSYRS